jgi:hypothetical protein
MDLFLLDTMLVVSVGSSCGHARASVGRRLRALTSPTSLGGGGRRARALRVSASIPDGYSLRAILEGSIGDLLVGSLPPEDFTYL